MAQMTSREIAIRTGGRDEMRHTPCSLPHFASGEARTKPLDPLANPPLRCWSGLTALDRDAILSSDDVRKGKTTRCSHIAHSPRSPSALPSPAVLSLLIPIEGLKPKSISPVSIALEWSPKLAYPD